MEIKKIDINKLNPAKYNPRKALKPGGIEYEKLKKSILEFGYVEPVIWNVHTGNIVGGHQRYTVLKGLGVTEIDCVIVNLDEAGYEWEDQRAIELSELYEIFAGISEKLKNRLILTFHFSHFIPMQHTPLWNAPLSLTNYRELLKNNFVFFDKNNLKVYIDCYTTTPVYAIEECLIERGYEYNSWIIEKILSSQKYKSLSIAEKMRLFQGNEFEYAIKKYNKNSKYPTDYIISNFNRS